MFSNEDLKCLDPEYFSIITTDAYDVTIMSRNTGHYWYRATLKGRIELLTYNYPTVLGYSYSSVRME